MYRAVNTLQSKDQTKKFYLKVNKSLGSYKDEL